MRRFITFFTLVFLITINTIAQDLSAFLDSVHQETVIKTTGTFKTIRLINGYTCETAGKNDLVFSISHRFGLINKGAYELFGLDESNIRLGFEYGLIPRLSLGIGRSSNQKLFDGYFKFKLFEQQTGDNNIPFTITWLSAIIIKSEHWVDESRDYPFSAQLAYTHELFIARKFSNRFSAQLVSAVVHRNMVDSSAYQNMVPALGAGVNCTINSWLSVSGEYYYLFPGNTADRFQNSLAFGIEIESGGGHVFQIQLSNSRGMTEKQFIPETNENWLDGDIRIGFNIVRVFNL